MEIDSSLATAVISGSFAIAGPLVTLFVTRKYDHRELKTITHGRRGACEGRWKGKIHQTLRDEPIELGILAAFKVGRKIIHGEIHVENPDKEIDITLTFTGGFHHEKFLKIDYSNSDKNVRQFGSMVLSLSNDGNFLSGKFAGYGSLSETIIGGDIELKKLKGSA